MRLIYNNQHGEKIKERTLKYWREWNGFDSESVLLKFKNPDEIKNTAFLSVTDENKIQTTVLFTSAGQGNP